MKKTIWKRVISVFLSLALCLTMLPVTAMADGYYYLSLDVDYQYDNGEYYYAFTNHSFDGKIYFDQYTSYSLKMYIDSKDVSEYIQEPSQDYNYTSFSIPAEIIADLYKQGEQHTLKYGLYDGSTEIYSLERNLTITIPSITVGSRNLESFQKSFVVGETYNVSDNISFYKYYRDWEHPNNESSLSDPQISKVEVINDISTPYAFSVRFESGNYILSADSIGKAKLNIYYDVDEGYYDENNGYISVELIAEQEFLSTDYDYPSRKVVQGSKFDIKLQLFSEIMGDNGYVSHDIWERPVKSYSWELAHDYGNKIKLIPDENDPSICKVELANDIQVHMFYYVNCNIVYYDYKGEEQQVKQECSFYVDSEYYEIICNIPEYMEVGETVTVHPSLVKNNGNEISEVSYDSINFYSAGAGDSNSLVVVDNGDGTYDITMNERFGSYIEVDISYNQGSKVSESFWIAYKYSKFSFVDRSPVLNESNGMTVCVTANNISADECSIILYLGEISEAKKIDSKYYSARYFEDVIYFTFSKEFINIFKQSVSNQLYAVAYKEGKEIASTSCYMSFNDSKINVNPLQDRILLNEPNEIYEFGTSYYSYDSDGGYMKSVAYSIDSIESKNSNIVSVNKVGNRWQYKGISLGDAEVVVKYHYYKDGKLKYDTSTKMINVYKYNYMLRFEGENIPYSYMYPGATYYINLFTEAEEYKDDNYVYSKTTDFKYECDVQNYDGLSDIKTEWVSDNRIKITVDSNASNSSYYLSFRSYNVNAS